MAVQNIQVRMRSSRTLMAWVWLMESAAWSGEPRLGEVFFMFFLGLKRRIYPAKTILQYVDL
jgi:uncharacterized membrane protein YczE